MARQVDLEVFAAAWSAGAVVVDVRTPEEYRAGHVPGALLAPVDPVAVLAHPPEVREVYVICASGNRSRWAADRLAEAGVEALSVAGGTRGWIASGRSVAAGSAPGSA
ncbi:rhodanese-like domain-containing protein [Streptomyces sp. C10-9-1]|uniref:rhodanese-like domain-containing protein n=1 Tax=Streptomyces sp. C10-9-1 TaxID=1859285 RepID=UPI0021122146|nr:rhodanese-like domain-containing protein [Streptomyces sp. C10-9-1]MCQ6555462.1 rhodanese-like domain-containing protein [Streptomyces sp. C10-9-1]